MAISRREALRTIGMGAAFGAVAGGTVHAATPLTTDPSLVFFAQVEAIEAEMAAVRTIDEERPVLARYNAISIRIQNGDFPKPTTAEGAAKALRRTVADGDFLEAQDRSLILAALGYLEGERA